MAKASKKVTVTKAQRDAAKYVLERNERKGYTDSWTVRKIAQAQRSVQPATPQ